jgi:aldehyde dehydrogenase (NAD+)/aldehyde dehydrogenase
MANVTKPVFKDRYDNFIEVNLLPQLKVNILTILHLSMVKFYQAARSTQEDIDLALRCSTRGLPSWSTTQ